MGDYTHTNLPLFGKHVPDAGTEVGPDGINQAVKLPGVYQIWTEIEGVPKLLFEFKAGKLLSRIENLRASQPPAPPEPPAPPAEDQ